MGTKAILFGFALLGFALGFVGWLIKGPVFTYMTLFVPSPEIVGAFLTGLAGSTITVVAVIMWSYLSER